MGRKKKIKDELVKVKRAYRRKPKAVELVKEAPVAPVEEKTMEEMPAIPDKEPAPECKACKHPFAEHYGTAALHCNYSGCGCKEFK